MVNSGEVDLGGIVVGSGVNTISGALVISNAGSQNLIILGAAFTPSINSPGGSVVYTNTTGNLGNGFSSASWPPVGTSMAPGSSLTIPLSFSTTQVGVYITYIAIWTSGGADYVLLTASAAMPPIANVTSSLAFGNLPDGSSTSNSLILCNSGGSALAITKSKPPDEDELFAPNGATDLHEGQNVDANTCASGQVTVNAAPLGVNRPDHAISGVWILNTKYDACLSIQD